MSAVPLQTVRLTRVRPWKLALIRRDWLFGLTAIGLVIAPLAAAVALAFAGEAGRPVALGGGLIFAGLVAYLTVIARLRRKWVATAAEELREKIGDRDPGESPVRWISDETWRRENAWDPELEVVEGPPDPTPCLSGAVVHEATRDDQARAPKVLKGLEPPPPEALAMGELEAALSDPPEAPRLFLGGPRWPGCCGDLCTLVGHRGVDADFVDAVPTASRLQAEVAEERERSEREEEERITLVEGKEELGPRSALFHCCRCGSVYLGGTDV